MSALLGRHSANGRAPTAASLEDPGDDDFRYDECSTCGCECEGCSEQVRDKDCEDGDGCPYCLCSADSDGTP